MSVSNNTRQRTPSFWADRPTRARITRLTGIVAVLGVAALVGVVSARAQSPTPGTFIEDSRPTVGIPSGASAVVVEGVGVFGHCSNGDTYSEAEVKSWTVHWINSGERTFTEISPQSTCANIGNYETLVSQIESYVETYGSNPGKYWGGFMLDEEAGYGFDATPLEALNSYTENLMLGTSGVSWYTQEDQPNSWTEGKYNNILGESWPAL